MNVWLSTDIIWRVGYDAITRLLLMILMRWHLSNNFAERSERIFYVTLSFRLIFTLWNISLLLLSIHVGKFILMI